MKILKSAPFLLFSAVFAAGLSLPAAADDTGEVKIISRQIERNLERVTPRSQGTRAVFNNNFQPRTKAKSNRKFNEGPIFGDNDCTRRTCGGAMFGPQTCKRIKLPCEDCGDQPKPVKPRPHIKNYVTLEEDIFQTIHHRCGDLPLSSWNGWISVSKKAVTALIRAGSAIIVSASSAAGATSVMPF